MIGASNSVALNVVKEFLSEKEDGLLLKGELFHMRCCAHILNLIVGDGLKELNDSISSIRNAVRYVRSSPSRLKRFKEACEEVNIESKALLCLDVVTRWNSTYMMLDAALKFKKAFKNLEGDANYTRYFEEEKKDGKQIQGPPVVADWEQAKVFLKFLKIFYDLTLKFSGSLYVTSNLFFQEIFGVQVQLNDLIRESDNLLARMALRMQQKYNKYWGAPEKLNLLTYIATVLDPRFKFEVVKNGLKYLFNPIIAEELIVRTEKMLQSLYTFYKETNSVPLPPSQVPRQTNMPKRLDSAQSSSSSLSFFLIKDRFVIDEEDTNDLDDYLTD